MPLTLRERKVSLGPLRFHVAAWFAALHVLTAASAPAGPVFYVDAQGGTDFLDNGSFAEPWATVSFAMATIAARGVTNGYTLYLRGGIYRETIRSPVSGSIHGEAVVRSYPGERAVVSGAELKRGWSATGLPGARGGTCQSGHRLSFVVRTSRWGRVYRVPAFRGY